MQCCVNCFKDSEVKAIIYAKKQTGNCDFCGGKNVSVFDLAKDSTLEELFEEILDVYSPASELPDGFPQERIGYIKDVLFKGWNIFNVNSEVIYSLITSICGERYRTQPYLFDEPVGIRQIHDDKYLKDHSILKGVRWEDFVEGIKKTNRFHGNYINTDVLSVFLNCVIKKHRVGEVFYRARICHEPIKYKPSKMGPPPSEKSKAGRVNPVGISVLYLSESKDTTLYEVRAGVYDYVTVGRFKLLHDIEIINLASIDQISPFVGDRFGFDKTDYAINLEHLRMIAQEIARPMRNDGTLDYLPTQYVCDYIKSKGFSGIEYNSTMDNNGINLAVFNAELFKCISTRIYDIKSINYNYEKV